MKKTVIYVFAALCVAMFAYGCDKETPASGTQADDPEEIVVPEGYVTLELSTKVPAKTVLYDSSVEWEYTDKITVFAGSNVTDNYEFSVLSATTSSATFQGVVKESDSSAESFIVSYPYSSALTLDGTILSGVEIKAVQTLRPDSFASGENPSVGKGGKSSIEFRNLAALIRVPVIGPVKVSKVVVTAPEGTQLAGKGSVDLSASEYALTISESASNVVTLTAEEAIDVTEGVNFYAVVAPQTSSLDCTVEVFLEDGTSMTKPLSSALARASLNPTAEYVGYDAPVFYGSANCYIGKAGQDISIDVTPHYADGWTTCTPTDNVPFAGKVASAEVLWKESTLAVTASYAGGKVNVSGISGTGNASVAIKDADGVILWSYHIWVPAADPTKTLTYPMDPDFSTVASYEVMPMALGAINTTGKADASGCYYQWGRKDPLGRIDISTSSYIECGVDWANELHIIRLEVEAEADPYDYAIKNPTKFMRGKNEFNMRGENVNTDGLWGNPECAFGGTYAKSCFDPCPAGYKTPPLELFTNFVKDGGSKPSDPKTSSGQNKTTSYFNVANLSTAESDGGYFFYYDPDDATKTDFYPFTGYRLEESGKMSCGTSGSIHYSAAGYDTSAYYRMTRMAYTTTQIMLYNKLFTPSGYTVRCIKE